MGFDWVKTSKNGNLAWGMGYYTRQNTEVCLIGVKKKPYRFKPLVRNELSAVVHQRLAHSEKPNIFREKKGKRSLELSKVFQLTLKNHILSRN